MALIRKIFWLPAVLLVALGGCATSIQRPLPTVPAVDLERYLGTWHQIALIPNRFQSMCIAETQAEYALDEEVIRVTNRCRKENGEMESANGVAKVVEGSSNTKLRVSFFRPFYGNYWVLALDPDYRWVLVGEPSRRYGWVLARTPTLDKAVLDKLLDRAVELGYERSAFRPSR